MKKQDKVDLFWLIFVPGFFVAMAVIVYVLIRWRFG